ncbi:aromatic acid exporter family protein [Clostridium sporogenes]|uniref:Aromatic acid exporter family protein n=1 Tax=Clostridium botulinum TaxID=1491 RepID=A0A6M0SWD2_CLOBO|nr:aromatic acid exporter family protein [Clostridium sporogenes]NFA59808.1 aromatic acid exporter family protein [Clostridium botulinum]NFI72160.1 aromatic acid exporter family protein [Clostridium sporogenes]NFL72581.1 aromatic acid exporter family protein [Clostridium sporogenes]NFM23698.1 aromatic acid exporter family protein [Clostridium sporogenes]NFP60992.1 aromatic acid exporter family protein [Clostridium sporogenes]
MRFIGYRTLKTAVGATIAMSIAAALGLKYSVAAGIITILSIQNTKRKSLNVAIQRIIACLLALAISSTLFTILGYNAIVFGLFLLLFIPLAVKFNLQEGIVVNSVLVTHILLENNVSINLFLNEISLMLIGAGVALLFNLYIPSIEREIKEDQVYIEDHMKEILIQMSIALRKLSVSLKEDELFNNLEERLLKAKKRAYINLNNYFLLDVSYYVAYMEMRIQQFETLKRMRQHFNKFFMTYEQTEMIADFTKKVADSLYEENAGEDLILDLENLRESFKKMNLPNTREEFENRALLFQFLNDMEQFLIIKNEFKRTIIDCDTKECKIK